MVRLERMGPVQLERLTGLLYTAKTATDIPSKLENLRQFNEELLPDADTSSLSNFLHILFELQFDRQSPVRKVVTQIIGEIGLKRLEFVPEIVPVLLKVLDDPAPAVARQAVASGNDLFQYALERVVTQGLHTSELDDMLKSAWSSMLELKEKIYSIAFQPGSSGVRFLALKFVEALVLLYTPDPRVSQERPAHDGKLVEFNILWLRRDHPLLNIGDLSVEASKRMSLLLDQLRFPAVKSLSNLVIIVLINCLATIAKKRPPYYGRILPVLLGLDPSCSIIEGRHASGVHLALKKAFLTLLKCTHPGAAPWRERLLGALRQMKGGFADGEIQESVKRSGHLEGEKEGSLHENDSKPSGEAFDGVHIKSERSSFGTDDANDFPEDDARSRKRLKSETQDDNSSQEPMSGSDDTGPVQQLVAMFGALVAQGEKAVGSLEILISSISADLLAEVVMANMRYLPTNYPQGERDDELVEDMTVFGSDTHAKYPSSFLSDVLSLSRSFQPVASQLNTRRSSSNEVMIAQEDELNGAAVGPSSVVSAGISLEAENEMFPAGVQTPSTALVTKIEMDGEDIPLAIHDENLASKIPGLESFPHTDRFSESMGGSSLVFTGVADVGQDQVTSSVARSNADSLPVTSGDRSEELSSRTAVTDSNSLFSSTATSVLASAVVLPKMSAPVVNLANEQKDQLQDLAFTRIIEAYKHISISGGSQVRFSLLACLGFEFPSDLDPWKLLQKHILEDYVSHEGHELTLRVLYRLFREIEEERDFFSSTTATNVYEIFLLNVAETLRDSFPPSDKSLSRLLGEAPYLPKPVLALLESLCSPGKSDKTEKDAQNGNRVTQGLSIVWSLILLRPPLREVCLKIALQSAVHHLEEVRMKAIRLVANKLYPLSSIAQQIETFAMESMSSAVNNDATENIATESSTAETQKTTMSENQTNEHQSTRDIDKDFSTNSHQSSKAQSSPLLSFTEAQRCMSLYFALCTKKHSLFHQVFVIYKDASKDVKQAIHSHIPILVRTMGRSTELLKIISDPPTGSEDLLMQVLKILTEGTVPSPELLLTIKKLFNSKIKDAEILFPILPFLPREEVLQLFRHLVNLPIKKFQVALGCVLQGSSNSAPVLSPTEVLIAIHEIDPERDGVPLKKVTDACNACFEQRQIFTQQVLAKVLNQLVEQIPLPLLFMRTVLQAIGAFPALMEFVMDILARLVSKQIWKYPKLWVGFLKCTQLTKPHSFHVLLKLPSPQLENALNKIADLKAPLVAHASQPDIRSTLPRSTLLVLGLISEAQTSGPAQSGQGQTVDTVNQPPTPPIETTVETSNEAQTVDRSNPAPAAETSNQAQTVDTSNSDKDKLTEKSVESPSKDMQTQDSKEPMSSSS